MACVKSGGSCVFDVLSGSVSTTYDYADLETKVAAMSQDVLLSMTDADFDWVAADPPPAARFKLHMTAEAAARVGATLLPDYPTHPFRLTCGGRTLYLGVMYFWCGQAALGTPVMDAVAADDDSLSLYLGAYEGAWCGLGSGLTELRERIERPEFRSVFCQRGVLQQLDPETVPTD
jgi:hypothetical protein